MNTELGLSPTRAGRPKERYLPGVEGVWFFIFADMTVFGIIFGSFMIDRHKNLSLFEESRQALGINFGGVNTLILLTGSMLVVLAIDALKLGKPQLAPILFGLASSCGFAFMVAKGLEYSEKLHSGITLLTNDFFMYYFVLTGMHLVHVIAGTVVLGVLCVKSRSFTLDNSSLALYESGATYWHMVDLIWVCLFPLLYLVR